MLVNPAYGEAIDVQLSPSVAAAQSRLALQQRKRANATVANKPPVILEMDGVNQRNDIMTDVKEIIRFDSIRELMAAHPHLEQLFQGYTLRKLINIGENLSIVDCGKNGVNDRRCPFENREHKFRDKQLFCPVCSYTGVFLFCLDQTMSIFKSTMSQEWLSKAVATVDAVANGRSFIIPLNHYWSVGCHRRTM